MTPMTPVELEDLRERFGATDPLATRLLEHAHELRALMVELAEHLNRPGPSPQKTAEYYLIAARVRCMAKNINGNELKI